MKAARPYVLCVAGFDPSAGAGLLADVKTVEANKVYGLACSTANTVQHEDQFLAANWTAKKILLEQIKLLTEKYKIAVVKVGIIESFELLLETIVYLKQVIPAVKIVWDPVLKSSSGFQFHNEHDTQLLEKICREIYLITPNYDEILLLGFTKDQFENAKQLSNYCAVFLKGGHNEKDPGRDFLFLKGELKTSFKPRKIDYPKHGSGCILSSAIAAFLAKEFPLQKACLKAREYSAHVMNSNKTLLVYHKI